MKLVGEILEAKGREVLSVTGDSTVYDAIRLMSEKEVGALLVMSEERLMGVITERDYARKVILEGKSSRQLQVSEIMTRQVLCVTPERTIDESMALMTDKRVRHLPVLENKKVVGLVSIGDLVKATIDEQKYLIEQLQHYISG